MIESLKKVQLDDVHAIYTGELPANLHLSAASFDSLWNQHPEEFHEIRIHGNLVRTPRWQQAYGVDYHYTGQVNKALPILPELITLLDWARGGISQDLNGVLLNWYDGEFGHYIGKHRDSTKNMLPGAPIVTISLWEERVFRLRPWKGKGFRDFPVPSNSVIVMPYETNLAWTHEVPKSTKYRGRRISVTIRTFEESHE